jgi:hypothetical protein
VAQSALTRTMQAMSGRTSWLLAGAVMLFLPLLGIVSLIFCNPRTPAAVVVATLPSPDGAFVAVSERVDDGAGFVEGPVHDEVHLLRRGDSVTDHGNHGKTSIFFIEDRGEAPQLHWTDGTHLSIRYHEGQDNRPFTRQEIYGVRVHFRKEISLPPAIAH